MSKRMTLPALLMAATLLLLPARALAAGEETGALAFPEDGSFQILIVADTQDRSSPEPAMLRLLNEALDQTAPDLVVFLGDQLHGPTVRTERAAFAVIDALVQPVAERNIPFAVVFGNHDDEGGVSKQTQLAHYQSFPGCLAVDGGLSGCGNYALTLRGQDGAAKCALFFLDSGSYAVDGSGRYDYVKQDQLDWFKQSCADLRAENGGASVPAYVFQHIIVPEAYELLTETDRETEGAVRGFGSRSDRYYIANPDRVFDGALREGPCPPEHNNGEFAAFVEQEVVAAFFGHDHVNDFAGTLEGVDLVAVPGMTFYIYGDPEAHGVRTLTLREDAPAEYESRRIYYQDLTDEPRPGLYAASLGTLVQNAILFGALAVLAVAAIVIVCVRRKKRRNRTAASADED